MILKKKVIQRAIFRVISSLLLFCPAFLLLNCTQQPAGETAKSGHLMLAVDRHIAGIAAIQTDNFSRYYSDATVTLLPDDSGNSLKHLLDGSVKAALISGTPEAAEDSLFAQQQRPIRREPVARDAIVCIVNSRNTVISLSTKELGLLFSERGKSGEVPLVIANDFRLLSLLAAKTGKKRGELSPFSCSSEQELIKRVSFDSRAVGLLFRSSFEQALKEGDNNNIRILPIGGGGEKPSLPTQQNIFEGRYPLVTLVYYFYYPGDALAAGFGSWLSSGAGQKAFERSFLAPYRLVERTIILK